MMEGYFLECFGLVYGKDAWFLDGEDTLKSSVMGRLL
jgi:hypothetical protein